jgi:rhodanese-related sulfurtransferase
LGLKQKPLPFFAPPCLCGEYVFFFKSLPFSPFELVTLGMQHSPGFLKLVESAKSRVREISVQEANTLSKSKGTYLIDVREQSEWNEGHAPGAIFLSKGIIERDIEDRIFDQNATILCYCGGGFRSALAADNLQKMGYTNVKSVSGGYKAWVAAGLPVSHAPEVCPRSPYERLGGMVYLPRLIDKCRLYPTGKLAGYNYLTVGFDKMVLDFLCIDGKEFESAAQSITKDEEILSWLKGMLGSGWPTQNAINEINERLTRRAPDTTEKINAFQKLLKSAPPPKRKIETYFDLIDLDEGRHS